MKIAINPLQYYVTPGGEIDWSSGPPYDDVLADVARSGFRAVQSKWDLAASPRAFRRQLTKHGLKPAPGYFAAPMQEPHALPELQAQFGRALEATSDLELSEIVVACPVEPARKATAGRRAGSSIDTEGLDRTSRALNALGEQARRRGVRLCFHPHVATPVETPDEIAFIIENTRADVVSLCIDTGHLAWGGMDDVAAFVEAVDHRIGVLHLKDIDAQALRRAVRSRWSYADAVRHGIWREPGDGDLDLDSIMRVQSERARWCVVEVDAPSRPTALDSLRACAEYVRRWTT